MPKMHHLKVNQKREQILYVLLELHINMFSGWRQSMCSLTWTGHPGCRLAAAVSCCSQARRWKVGRTSPSWQVWQTAWGSWREKCCPLLPGRSKHKRQKSHTDRTESLTQSAGLDRYLSFLIVGMVPVIHAVFLQNKVPAMPHPISTDQLKHSLGTEPRKSVIADLNGLQTLEEVCYT